MTSVILIYNVGGKEGKSLNEVCPNFWLVYGVCCCIFNLTKCRMLSVSDSSGLQAGQFSTCTLQYLYPTLLHNRIFITAEFLTVPRYCRTSAAFIKAEYVAFLVSKNLQTLRLQKQKSPEVIFQQLRRTDAVIFLDVYVFMLMGAQTVLTGSQLVISCVLTT